MVEEKLREIYEKSLKSSGNSATNIEKDADGYYLDDTVNNIWFGFGLAYMNLYDLIKLEQFDRSLDD